MSYTRRRTKTLSNNVDNPKPILGVTIAIHLAVTGKILSVVNPNATNPAALFTGPPKSNAVVAERINAYTNCPDFPAASRTDLIHPFTSPPNGVMM